MTLIYSFKGAQVWVGAVNRQLEAWLGTRAYGPIEFTEQGPPVEALGFAAQRLFFKEENAQRVVYKLCAFEKLLQDYPEWIGKVVIIQLTSPADSPLDCRRGWWVRLAHINVDCGSLYIVSIMPSVSTPFIICPNWDVRVLNFLKSFTKVSILSRPPFRTKSQLPTSVYICALSKSSIICVYMSQFAGNVVTFANILVQPPLLVGGYQQIGDSLSGIQTILKWKKHTTAGYPSPISLRPVIVLRMYIGMISWCLS